MGLPDRDRIPVVDIFIFRVRWIDSLGEWKSYLRNLINKLTIFFFFFLFHFLELESAKYIQGVFEIVVQVIV